MKKRHVAALGITAGILMILGGIAYSLWPDSESPRQKMRSAGERIFVENLSFYRTGNKVPGKVYRPALDSLDRLPVVVYVQNMEHGEPWCKDIAGGGWIAYSFDFSSADEKRRNQELIAVIKGVKSLPYADKKRIYLLGEGAGCLSASQYAFSHPRETAGLMLISPGFNPLEISRLAKRYPRPILVMDASLGRAANLEEIRSYAERY